MYINISSTFQVQAEALRVELKEKQNLLCEAATALELMEQSQKSREEACQSTIEELNRKIEFLEVWINETGKISQRAFKC